MTTISIHCNCNLAKFGTYILRSQSHHLLLQFANYSLLSCISIANSVLKNKFAFLTDCFYICTQKNRIYKIIFLLIFVMDLVNRLKFFLETHQIAISQFADTCRIPRPTLSQILSGRNKKISDELITKIHNAYPELSVLWLMFGEGEMEVTGNIEISEPQNGVKSPYPIADAAESQQENPTGSENSLFTYSESEKFGGENFGENLQNSSATTAQAHNTLADEPENSISFFVDYSDSKNSTDAESSVSDTPAASSGRMPQPSQTAPLSSTSDNAPVNGSSETVVSGTPATETPAAHPSIPLSGGGSISLQSPEGKKISNIVVFYSDNSFQSFSPTV